ncbi:hypothetical protein CPAST_c13080 [Clostridium pasteurianum DSM 525 = ATCC 6013]|uniref:DUF4363 family protein n=1 Tax=Clostridium pasteurianum DSM 525 = ATCC 6013 TaxID=1262449 RepID=A0A0H3J3K6_CLOPA|nr:DUF4363 family protein [Clostridium pasteurianum]AJA47407.1 hypothetical protein CPAST_c13080 [Clostridium pasteurianum DSM 525 = ATCC 6013]AJA51395.1 hypothetical protein CLPA_c13080 [Clostridium pasteurianum DSM 525 = ATCC 6013]AOZ74734.1 hypothetical protein AQ983_06305 [Clostridium pasteurianum DSM 525 = ATCC 6013]AOZ78530.1 hypothetical protein AQ984_06295 [Clostridium pasteurianum]ELP58743.1 hypothetical protein F502_13208 [Clostridium pasteurianum DSM 525 = ATCC 6013]
MKNIVITFILFISMIFVCFISLNYLNKTSYNMYSSNNSVKKYIYNNNWEKADKLSNKLSKDWHMYADNFSLFVNHTLIDDISIEEHKLEEYIKCKNKEEALASANTIQFLIERIRKLEKFNIQNVF